MAQHKHTLYISDLDGTLLNENSIVSHTTASVLNNLIDKGMLFSIATARTPATVVKLMEEVNIKLPVILMTGALVYDISHNQYLSVSSFPQTVVRNILDATSDMPASPMVYCIENSQLCVLYSQPLTCEQRTFIEERNGTPFKRYIEVEGNMTVPSTSVLIFFMGDFEQLEQVYNTIKPIDGHCSYLYRDSMRPELGYLEVYPCGTTKAAAIKQLAQIACANEIVVFGDNVNDVPMFEIADRSYAMENAVDEAKAKATRTIASNTNDGVAQFLLEEYKTLR